MVFGPEDTQFTSQYGFYTSTVSIPFYDLEGMTALAYRFVDEEKDLYTSQDHPVYSLLNMTGEMTSGESEYYTKDGISYSLSLQYPEGLPANVEEKLLELGVFNDDIAQELKDSLTSESSGYYDVSVYAFCVGDYVSLNFAESAYGWDENGNQCYDYYLNAYYSYELETGEPIELADLFVEQSDPEQLLRDGVFANQRRMSDLYDDPPKTDAEIWESVDESLPHITSFAVDTTSLNLLSIWEDPDTGKTRTQWTAVPYEDIGCQHMTIFD